MQPWEQNSKDPSQTCLLVTYFRNPHYITAVYASVIYVNPSKNKNKNRNPKGLRYDLIQFTHIIDDKTDTQRSTITEIHKENSGK